MNLPQFKGESALLVKKGIKILWYSLNDYGPIIYHDHEKC